MPDGRDEVNDKLFDSPVFVKGGSFTMVEIASLRDAIDFLEKWPVELQNVPYEMILRACYWALDGSHPLRSLEERNQVRVIYSRSGETADSVIEELEVNESFKRKVFVVTSDYSQQKVIFRKNTYRKSVREFGLEIRQVKNRLSRKLRDSVVTGDSKFYPLEKRLNPDQSRRIKGLREQ